MTELEKTFLEACDKGDLVKAKACIDLGVDVNCVDQRGYFPLLVAVVNGNMDLFNILMAHPQIDINKEIDIEGLYGRSTALMSTNNLEMIRRLLSAPGISISHQSKGGMTAAMVMVAEGCVEIVKLFRGYETVDWNVQNRYGATCAIIAARKGNVAILKILRNIPSVNWNLTNRDGDSALSTALHNNDMEAVKIILSVPSLVIDADQLRRHNIPRDTIIECLEVVTDNLLEQIQQVVSRNNNNLKCLVSMLGGGERGMEKANQEYAKKLEKLKQEK